MPRAAWLAGGSLTAALLPTVLPIGPELLAGTLLAAFAAGLLGAAFRRPGGVWAAMGAGILVGRIGLGASFAGPAPTLDAPDQRLWVAEVISISAPARGQQRAVLGVHAVAGDSRSAATDSNTGHGEDTLRVYATLPRYPAVAPGDRFRFSARLVSRPQGSSFGKYLASKGIVATTDVPEIEPAPAAAGPARWLEELRRAAGDALARTLPEPQAGLAAGILVGLRDRVGREVASAFTASGLSHIVAISGWNIAIVAAVVSGLLRRRERRSRSLMVAAGIALYTIFAGASASVVRAALMAGTTLLARESGRRGAAATALGLAAFAMLLLDPDSATDPGYQLSVAATAGLLLWSRQLGEALQERLPRAPEWLLETLAVSLAAQAATLPLVLLSFGRLSLIAPLANLVVAPLVAPAMLFGIVALAAGVAVGLGAPLALGVAVASPGSALLAGIVGTAEVAAAVPLASIELESPWNAVGAGCAALLLIAISSSRTRAAMGALARTIAVDVAGRGAGLTRSLADRHARVSAASARADPRTTRTAAVAQGGGRVATAAATLGIAAVLAILSLLLPTFTGAGGARLSMTVLDIGQGDAILLEGPRGGRILVDSGPDPDRLLNLLDARLPPWDRRLDLVVLTHPHEDHVAGLPLLLERYRIAAFAEPGMRGPGPGYRAFARELLAGHLPGRTLAAGDRLRLDGADIVVRWPRRGVVPLDPPDDGKGINNVSIVLDLQYGARRFLLTGDVEQEVDPELLVNGLGERSVDVLKVPHHGSGTATTDALLSALRPRVAIVSAGAGNPYGHPNRRTLERIAASGARVLRTDRDGSVTVTTDGSDLRVSSTGPRPFALTAAAAVPSLAGWTCGVPAGARTVSTIPQWQSRIASSRPPSFSSFGRPSGSSLTSVQSRRWPPSWPSGSSEPEPRTIDASWKPQPSFTTWTSSSPRATRSRVSSTPRPLPAGWPRAAITSSAGR